MLKFTSFLLIILFSANSYAINLSDSWIGEAASKKRNLESVKANNFMISSANEKASQAGFEMLKKGGNAIDAAIATQMVLNVVEPQSSGIGGGGFLLYYNTKNNNYQYFNGRESAPQEAHETMFLDKNGKPKEFLEAVQGGMSVATPGALKMLKTAHEKYGKLPWQELFEPAINLARNGYEVDDRLLVNLKKAKYLKNFKETAELYLDKNGEPYPLGTIIKNEKLAKTFEIIAKEGIKPFYEGEIANKIVKKVQNAPKNPGLLQLSDLKNYQVKVGDLVCATYRIKYKICSMPPPSSGGITVLQILGILENFELEKLSPNSLDSIHLITEATRLAYEDRNKYIGDTGNVPITQMLDKKYLKDRASLINLKKAKPNFEAGKFSQITNDNKNNILASYQQVEPFETTHMSIIDQEGNAVAFTSSIEYFFGSALSVDGFLLNNHMTDFSFIPEIDGKKVANRVEPFKQPRSSMSPTFVFDENDKLKMVVGSPGGPRIIQFATKTIIGVLDWQMDIQKAISLPNFTVLNNILEIEQDTAIAKLAKDLEKMGHKVAVKDQVSGLHAIVIDNDNKLVGGADPRRGGIAIGE